MAARAAYHQVSGPEAAAGKDARVPAIGGLRYGWIERKKRLIPTEGAGSRYVHVPSEPANRKGLCGPHRFHDRPGGVGKKLDDVRVLRVDHSRRVRDLLLSRLIVAHDPCGW